SDNMARQENIETASTVTSITTERTVISNHNRTVIITQNNQKEPISFEFINLDISNALQKAKNLANSQEQAISPQAAPKKVIDVIMAESNWIKKDKRYTATRSLIGHLQSQPEGLQRCTAAQRVPDPCRSVKNCMNSYLTVRKFLGHPNTCKLLNGGHPLMEKKNMMLLTAELRKNNPPPPKQVPRPAPGASSSNSNMKKHPQTQNKGKGKAPATKPYSQGYRVPNIQQDAMENLFQMARTMMELQKKEEGRLRFQK
ncbi:hypothetical protein O181_076688, partial [Austropuccinia psidii MF-1]|nr:hypothetical protein [Austropuccinia psidii MF-1]